MITALAIMLAIAGYLQFAGKNLEEDYLGTGMGDEVNQVDSGGVITDNYTAENLQESPELAGLLDLSEEDIPLLPKQSDTSRSIYNDQH